MTADILRLDKILCERSSWKYFNCCVYCCHGESKWCWICCSALFVHTSVIFWNTEMIMTTAVDGAEEGEMTWFCEICKKKCVNGGAPHAPHAFLASYIYRDLCDIAYVQFRKEWYQKSFPDFIWKLHSELTLRWYSKGITTREKHFWTCWSCRAFITYRVLLPNSFLVDPLIFSIFILSIMRFQRRFGKQRSAFAKILNE